jgi:hypothetical protein
MADVYVEFPVDPIVGVHWAKKKGDGGGGGPPEPCGGELNAPTGTIAPTKDLRWHIFGSNNGGGARQILATFSVTIPLQCPAITVAPFPIPHPAFTFEGVTLYLGISEGGGAFAPVGVDGLGDIDEGNSATGSLSYEMPAWNFTGAPTIVAFAVTYTDTHVADGIPYWSAIVPVCGGEGVTSWAILCSPAENAAIG